MVLWISEYNIDSKQNIIIKKRHFHRNVSAVTVKLGKNILMNINSACVQLCF